MVRVFISHATQDQEVAMRIARFLEGEGIVCWIAPRDVPPGMEYGAAIMQGIESSGALILVLSENSNDSHFVRREVERAVAKAKPVLPLRIREVAPSGALEFFISSAQWVEASRPPLEQHLAQLAHAIRAVAGEPFPITPQPQPRPGSRLPWLLGGAALLLAAAAGLVLWAPWSPAWQRDPATFLVGSWCLPMSGEAFAREDITALGGNRIAIEAHYSHSTQVDRLTAAVAADGQDIEFTWLDAASADVGPARYRVESDSAIRLVRNDAGEVTDVPPMTRCAPDSGNAG